MAENVRNDSLTQKLCSDIWWILLLRGLAMLLLGVLLITRPGITIMIIIQFIGVYWFIDGIFTLLEAIRGRKTHQNWGWGIFVGVLSILAGVVVFIQPLVSTFITQMVLIYYLAFMSIFFGITSVVTGIRLRKEIDNEWSMIMGGVFPLLFGALLLMKPLISSLVMIWIVAIYAIGGGIALVISSFGMRKIGKEGLDASTPT